MIIKRLAWTLKRHPFLYKTRFRLLSKNVMADDIEDLCYNSTNSKEQIPQLFFDTNDRIFKNYQGKTDLDKAIYIATWLRDHIKVGPGLSLSSEKTLKIMLEGRGGVCSDLAQIFNNFCVINDLKVREWGITRAPFDIKYGGHSVNEVYSEHLKKWILIDVSYNIQFIGEKGIPLSVTELYSDKTKDIEKKKMTSFNSKYEYNPSYVESIYLSPQTVPFLICNYSNKTYDFVLNLSRPRVPVFVSHFLIFLMAKSYSYVFPLHDYRHIFKAQID